MASHSRRDRTRSPFLRHRRYSSRSPSSERCRSRGSHRYRRSSSSYDRSRSRELHRSRRSRSPSFESSRSRESHRSRRSRSPSYDRRRSRGHRYSRRRSGSYSVSPHYHRSRSRSRSRRYCYGNSSRSRSPSNDRYHGRDSRSRCYAKQLGSDSRSRSQSPICNSQPKAGIEKNELSAFVSEFVDGIAKVGGDSTQSTALAEMEEILMMKLGIPASFDSTKGKQVPDADVSAVRLPSKRQPRQYMNRRCGFNKPLPSERNR